MRVNAIVVAAGSGIRANMNPPKQFQQIEGKPVLARSLNKFLSHPKIKGVTVVLSKEHETFFQDIIHPCLNGCVSIVDGGNSRTQSVISGLNSMQDDSVTHILIHDGVRPFVSNDLIDRVINALHHHSAVVPGIAISDALWRQNGGNIIESLKRDGVIRVQTPQGFNIQALREAYRLSGKETADDDAAIAIAAGIKVRVVDGQEDNVKLTTRNDFQQAQKISGLVPDIRTGTGFDVHRFTEGSEVILCGVRIPHQLSLEGHSDADVVLHAITDAIYGAIGQGDIGRWFPPTQPEWKDADSIIFLNHASKLASQKGYYISSLDCTVICEAPKIAPHAEKMRQNLASILNLDANRINIKATTSEGLGFTGRGEGIASLSTVQMVAL